MMGTLSVVDSHTGPCLCSTSMSLKTGGELVSQMKRKQVVGRAGWLELGSSFVDSCHDWRLSSKMTPGVVNKKSSRKARTLVVVNGLGGQYEETFGDVKTVNKPSVIFIDEIDALATSLDGLSLSLSFLFLLLNYQKWVHQQTQPSISMNRSRS